jgi:protein-tyrosine phosphatase
VTAPAGSLGRIDVHSHLLPGIDDGCKTVEESIECARALVGAGYTHAFCTPHIWPTYKGVSRVSVPRWCKALEEQLVAAEVPLKLLPGGELNLFLGVEKTPEEEIIPLALGKYMLVDMWAEKIPDFFESAVRRLQGMGLTVILAHPSACGLCRTSRKSSTISRRWGCSCRATCNASATSRRR